MSTPVAEADRQRRRRGTGRRYVSEHGYIVITIEGHPLADASGRIYEHRAVLFAAIGPGPHRCHWCRRFVDWTRREGVVALVVDHLDDDGTNNERSNLVPSCRTCNSRRATRSDFLTHCAAGHEWTSENTYLRPDTGGRQCRSCKRTTNHAAHAKASTR